MAVTRAGIESRIRTIDQALDVPPLIITVNGTQTLEPTSYKMAQTLNAAKHTLEKILSEGVEEPPEKPVEKEGDENHV
jgi:hypothetical protein